MYGQCLSTAMKEAVQRLKEALGHRYFAIRMEMTFGHFGPDSARWQVYDGLTRTLHVADTLPGAVNACLIAIADVRADAKARSSSGPPQT